VNREAAGDRGRCRSNRAGQGARIEQISRDDRTIVVRDGSSEILSEASCQPGKEEIGESSEEMDEVLGLKPAVLLGIMHHLA
jgi:hypothetical protein